jgi:putative transposase
LITDSFSFILIDMELVTKVKLLPNPEQANRLRETLEQSNAACNVLSQLTWESKRFGQWAIHEMGYAVIREQFALSSQVAIRCIAKAKSPMPTRAGRTAR